VLEFFIHQAMPVENLLPRAAYHADETGYWGRAGYLTGVFFGIWMAIFAAIPQPYDANLLVPRTTRILICLASGIPFGLYFRFVMRWLARRTQDALYDGKSWIDVPPPSDAAFSCRLPCTMLMGRRKAVGGVLYLGPQRSVFACHKRNRSESGKLLQMGALSELTIEVGSPPVLSGLQRCFNPHPQPLLEVRWPDGAATFQVPRVRETCAQLTQLARTSSARPT
jgi:hypothetical protein